MERGAELLLGALLYLLEGCDLSRVSPTALALSRPLPEFACTPSFSTPCVKTLQRGISAEIPRAVPSQGIQWGLDTCGAAGTWALLWPLWGPPPSGAGPVQTLGALVEVGEAGIPTHTAAGQLPGQTG